MALFEVLSQRFNLNNLMIIAAWIHKHKHMTRVVLKGISLPLEDTKIFYPYVTLLLESVNGENETLKCYMQSNVINTIKITGSDWKNM